MGVVPTANGSCRVRSKGCDIFVAIKCDIGIPTVDEPDMGIVNVSVEFGCSVLSRSQDLSGRQTAIETEALAEVVANQVQSMCFQSVDRKQFCIEPKRACWIVSVDILVERIDGPLIDPISIGIRAALLGLELPIVSLPPPDKEQVETFPKVDLLGGLWKLSPDNVSAICVSVGVFCDSSITAVDLDRIEELLAKSSNNSLITVAVNDQGKCFGIHKWGTGILDPAVLKTVISSACQVGREVSVIVTKVVS
jgi:exosome complex component RRP42